MSTSSENEGDGNHATPIAFVYEVSACRSGLLIDVV